MNPKINENTMEKLAQIFVTANRIKSESTKKVVADNFIRTLKALDIKAEDVEEIDFDRIWLTDGQEIEI